jgi:hypothetical protein
LIILLKDNYYPEIGSTIIVSVLTDDRNSSERNLSRIYEANRGHNMRQVKVEVFNYACYSKMGSIASTIFI